MSVSWYSDTKSYVPHQNTRKLNSSRENTNVTSLTAIYYTLVRVALFFTCTYTCTSFFFIFIYPQPVKYTPSFKHIPWFLCMTFFYFFYFQALLLFYTSNFRVMSQDKKKRDRKFLVKNELQKKKCMKKKISE